MIKLRSFVHSVLLASLCQMSAIAGSPFPAPHSGATLDLIEQSVDTWVGKPVAFPGRVLRLEDGYEGRPLLRILMAKPNPEQRQVWVSSQVPGNQQFSVGDVVIVYGKLQLAGEDDPVTTPHYDKTYHVLGECVVNATTKRIYSAPSASQRCQAWRAGDLPEG